MIRLAKIVQTGKNCISKHIQQWRNNNNKTQTDNEKHKRETRREKEGKSLSHLLIVTYLQRPVNAIYANNPSTAERATNQLSEAFSYIFLSIFLSFFFFCFVCCYSPLSVCSCFSLVSSSPVGYVTFTPPLFPRTQSNATGSFVLSDIKIIHSTGLYQKLKKKNWKRDKTTLFSLAEN